ncbi:MAG TPA: universal stress protein [Acidimicrobiales bacterium]|nr:universal stress protein [Acidimicrobiales bacterium]
MTVILAAVDDSDVAPSVLATAGALTELLHGRLRALHVREPGTPFARATTAEAGVALEEVDGEPVDALVDAVSDPEVGFVVVGARGSPEGPRPCGHVALAVAQGADKPVLVVPPNGAREPTAPIRRVVVPLEGTPESSGAVTEALRLLSDAGVALTVVHVFDADTVPRFWDRSGYAEESFAAEFAARWCEGADVPVRLRRGPASTAVLDVADAEEADVIALGWSQDLSPGRARVVHAVLDRACIPVLLVPVHTT